MTSLPAGTRHGRAVVFWAGYLLALAALIVGAVVLGTRLWHVLLMTFLAILLLVLCAVLVWAGAGLFRDLEP